MILWYSRPALYTTQSFRGTHKNRCSKYSTKHLRSTLPFAGSILALKPSGTAARRKIPCACENMIILQASQWSERLHCSVGRFCSFYCMLRLHQWSDGIRTGLANGHCIQRLCYRIRMHAVTIYMIHTRISTTGVTGVTLLPTSTRFRFLKGFSEECHSLFLMQRKLTQLCIFKVELGQGLIH
jgi:hypothetical protein